MTESDKQKALMVFNTFIKLMRPFVDLFPSGQINWDKSGLCSEISFEGEFDTPNMSYIRFTEEIRKEEE